MFSKYDGTTNPAHGRGSRMGVDYIQIHEIRLCAVMFRQRGRVTTSTSAETKNHPGLVGGRHRFRHIRPARLVLWLRLDQVTLSSKEIHPRRGSTSYRWRSPRRTAASLPRGKKAEVTRYETSSSSIPSVKAKFRENSSSKSHGDQHIKPWPRGLERQSALEEW